MRRRATVGSLIRKILLAGIFLSVGAVVGIAAVFYYLSLTLPAIGPLLEGYHPLETSRIVAADGTVIGELFEERRTVVSMDRIPDVMVNAVIAAEDAEFRTHEGLDYPGILRAIKSNLLKGERSQGASTITQQVARTFFLTREKTYSRKIREILLTKRIEERLTKDEILFLYLNQINFGHARYGVSEAARFYFGKAIEDITLEEAALIAGIPKGPSIYSPVADLEASKKRQRYVLGEMAKVGFISEAEQRTAADSEIRLVKQRTTDPFLAPEAVKRVIAELDGVVDIKTLRRGGYTIETSLRPNLQVAARDALTNGLREVDRRNRRLAPYKGKGRWPGVDRKKPGTLREGRTYIAKVTGHDGRVLLMDVHGKKGVLNLDKSARHNPDGLAAKELAAKGSFVPVSIASKPVDGKPLKLQLETGPQGALVAVSAANGSILAIVGGDHVPPGGFDRSTEAKRQPGSTFKPLVYLTAIHQGGYTAASLIDDAPEVHGEWKPSNSAKDTFAGTVRFRQALARSLNLPAIKLITQVGPEAVVEMAERIGVTSSLEPNPSLALGTSEVSPLEMAGAFNTLAMGGKHTAPYIVKRVTGPDGTELPLSGKTPTLAVSEQEAYIITSLLKSVIESGTAKAARSLNRPLAGKTGTSNDQRDAWFVGFSPDVTCAVWVGYDDLRSVGRKEYGGKAALPIWMDFMKAALEDVEKRDFPEPEGITHIQIDPASGQLAYEGMENAIFEVFIEGTEPTESAVPPDLVNPEDFLLDQLAEEGDGGPEAVNE